MPLKNHPAMKALLRIIMFAMATAAMVWSCKKEPNENGSGVNGEPQPSLRSSLCYHNIPKICGMFKFDSWAQYEELYDCLDAENEAYLDSFEAAHSGLNDEQFNDLADSIGFVDEQTLINFETFQSFTSYRSVMAAAEATWLAGGADPASDPDIDNVIDDEIEEAIRTTDGALWVDGTIYLSDAHGDSWVIPGASCTALDSILQGIGNNAYKVVYDDGTLLCNNEQVDYMHHYYDNDKKFIRYKLRWKWGGYHTVSVAKLKMFRKKNTWRRFRTKIFVKTFGTADTHNGNKCDQVGPYAKQKGWKRRCTLRAKNKWNSEHTFETGLAKGQYEFQDASSPLQHELYYPE